MSPSEDIHLEFTYGIGSASLASCLTLIYSRLYTGKWNKRVPNISQYENLDFLYYVNYEFVAFHRNHPKYGQNIVEYGINHMQNAYCFFDYSRLQSVFEWYENHEFNSPSPPIPTYFALPSDRHFFGTAEQEW